MLGNDPFYGCFTFRTLRTNGSAGFSRPVRFPLPKHFGKTRKYCFNAGQRSFLWLLKDSHTQTSRPHRILPPGRVSIAQNPSARLRNPPLMPANDPFHGCLTFRTLRRNDSAGLSRPVAFPSPRTFRQDSEMQF